MSTPTWPTCRKCTGVRIDPGDTCLAHLNSEDRERVLSALGPGADIDVRGVEFTSDLLRVFLAAFTKPGWGPEFGHARFDGARFTSLNLSEATFRQDCSFAGALFVGSTSFAHASFEALAEFAGATFADDPNFVDAQLTQADFSSVTFAAPGGSQLGRFHARELDLSDARSNGPLTIHCWVDREIVAERLRYAGTLNLQLDGVVTIDAPAIRSASALTLTCRDGDLTLADAAFGTPSTISSGERLLALDKVDATNLTLDGLNLDACRFKGCHNRDKLRIGGPLRFAGTPHKSLWTKRYVLAEKHEWRAMFDRRPRGWYPERCRRPSEPFPQHFADLRTEPPGRQHAANVQSIYRDLRKGREDAKDEPGATDFYFGEMEMRRMAAARISWERTLLTAYWAISGYGLRASRALISLVLVLALGTAGFATIGFASSAQTVYLPVTTTQPVTYRQVSQPGPKPGWTAAIDQSVDSATALLRQNTPRPLTTPGRVIEILLRLLGPLLLGLAVLALRNRVKR